MIAGFVDIGGTADNQLFELDQDFQWHYVICYLFMFNDLRREVIAGFVYIGGTADNHIVWTFFL